MVLRCVIASECDQRSKCQTKWIKNLCGRIQPNHRTRQFLHIWCIHVHQTVAGALQCYGTNKEYGEYNVREQRCEINDLHRKWSTMRTETEMRFNKKLERIFPLNWLIVHLLQLTLPELWMPFIMIRKTAIHAANKHSTIHHFKPPLSSIDAEASSVVWYQKYVVGDLHSGSVIFNVLLIGHVAHGNSICWLVRRAERTIANKRTIE